MNHRFENDVFMNLFYRNCVTKINGKARKKAWGKYKKAQKFPALTMNIRACVTERIDGIRSATEMRRLVLRCI